MASDGSRHKFRLSPHIGWCVLAAAISQLPLIVGGLAMMQVVPRAGRLLLLLSLPTALILTAGGIGLILRKSFGYYCVYVATFFGGLSLGGLKISYIPFIQGRIKLGPATEDLFLLLNLLLVAILVWEHFKHIREMDSSTQDVPRIVTISLLLLGAGSILVGRSMVQRDKGQVQSASNLP